jgi:hypothetical protein
MTAERLLNAIAGFLEPQVTAAGGVFALSETVARTISLLSGSPGRWRVIVQWQRTEPTGNRGERRMTLLVIVQQSGQNLGVNPGDVITVNRPSALSLTTADDGGAPTVDSDTASLNNAPLMQRCTQVCAWVRSLRFTNQDVQQQWPVMQPGADYWLNDPAFPTRQIAHEFTVNFGLSQVTEVGVTA